MFSWPFLTTVLMNSFMARLGHLDILKSEGK